MGVIFLIALFVSLVRLTKTFSRMKSIEGGLLIGMLISWLMYSNFLVVLEFPYYAIPFWVFLGIVYQYYRKSLVA